MERAGIQDEIDYWTRELALDGAYAEYTRRRLSRDGRRLEHPTWIDPLVAALVAHGLPQGRSVPRALDLGCGPLGTLGSAHEVGQLEVTGVDPLADVYLELRRRFGIDYPQPLIAAGAEDLGTVVEPQSIDIVYSRNSLDHAENVQLCFDQIARVLRPGGIFCLEVFAWEGRRENYDGMHGFDFHVQRGALHCTDRARRSALDLSAAELVLVHLTPEVTPEPAGVGADPITLRAVFAKSDDWALLSRLADACVEASGRARIEGWLDPAGPLAERLVGNWSPAVLHELHPKWADALSSTVKPSAPGVARVLEVGAGVLPSFSWAAHVGLARVVAYDRHADVYAKVFERFEAPTPPVPVTRAEPDAALAAAQSGSFDLVHLHDTPWTSNDPARLVAAAAAALAPHGILFLEGPANGAETATWRQPVGTSMRVGPNGLCIEYRGRLERDTVTLDPQAFGLDLCIAERVDCDDPLRGTSDVMRVALRRRA